MILIDRARTLCPILPALTIMVSATCRETGYEYVVPDDVLMQLPFWTAVAIPLRP